MYLYYERSDEPILVWSFFLQVMHSFAGLVKANPMTTLAQVYSRLFVVWAVVDGVPGVRICTCTEIHKKSLSACW